MEEIGLGADVGLTVGATRCDDWRYIGYWRYIPNPHDGCTADNDQLGYRVMAMAKWF